MRDYGRLADGDLLQPGRDHVQHRLRGVVLRSGRALRDHRQLLCRDIRPIALRAPASAEVAGGNGVYLYFGGFPIHSYYHANYWVDVVFQTAFSTTTTLTTTVTITAIAYTYDPLSRLTDATYSNGQRFQYAYDEVGNRTVQTATSSLSQ